MAVTRTSAAVLFLAAVAACADDRPPATPGDTVTTTVGDGDGDGDGDIDAATEGFAITGAVCVMSDVRTPGTCDTSDIAGITISDRDSTASTTTGTDGTFTLALAQVSSAVLVISTDDGRVRTTTQELALGATGAQGVLLPVPSQSIWDAIVTATIGAEPDNSGAILAYVEPGAEVTPPETTTVQPFYDDGGATSWSQVGLAGASGVAILFGVPADANQASFTSIGSGGSPIVSSTVPLASATTTVVTVDLTE